MLWFSRSIRAIALALLVLPACASAQTDPACTAMTGTHLRLRKLDMSSGEQRALYRGTLPLPDGAVIDPSVTGMRFLMTDDGGTTMADVSVPPGAASPGLGLAGWAGNRLANSWIYTDRDGSVGGIRRVLLRGAGSDPRFKIVVYGKDMTFAPPVRHVYLNIYFTAEDGSVVCGRRFFHELGCTYRNQGGKLNCY